MATNGVSNHLRDERRGSGGVPDGNALVDSSNILNALKVIHNPSTNNDTRKQASGFLEGQQNSPDAAQHGYNLACNHELEPIVRHFGLSLLEHTIISKWHDLSDSQSQQVRDWTIELGRSVQQSDPPFLRNKVAQLWIELTKKSWGVEWYDLDLLLIEAWTSRQDFIFVLTVLENLSEDVFVREDSAAVLRGSELNTALVQIFTSASQSSGNIKVGERTIQLRNGDEGWMSRISVFLQQLPSTPMASQQKGIDCIVKAIATLRSVFAWIPTAAIVGSNCFATICMSFSRSDIEILTTCTETLLALYSRARFEEAEFNALVIPMCLPQSVEVLQRVYQESIVGSDDMDSPKYVLSKKLSEMISCLCAHLMQPMAEKFLPDLSALLSFLANLAEHESFIVSIPAVHSWTKILESRTWSERKDVEQCIEPLLQFACSRTLQYDQLPEEPESSAVAFVNNEFDLFPERQGFFLNYRKLCCQIIELICYSHPTGALSHIISRIDLCLDRLLASNENFDPAQYFNKSTQVLEADAQFTVVESAFKGISLWQSAHKNKEDKEAENFHKSLTSQVKSWSIEMLSKRVFKDPIIKHRIVKCAVEISSRVLYQDNSFAFNVLEYIMTTFIPQAPAHTAYSEAIVDLHMYSTNELRRLAIRHAEYFSTFYDQLEVKFRELVNGANLEEKCRADLSAVLFTIAQRSGNMGISAKQTRLSAILNPLMQSWQDEQFRKSLSSYEDFCSTHLFDRVGPYLSSLNASKLEDWSGTNLDGTGLDLQKKMLEMAQRLPLRMSRALLGASTDKLPRESPAYRLAGEIWSPTLTVILEPLLHIVSYSHRLQDAEGWPNTQPGTANLVARVLKDRFWQSGISEGNMNQFYDKIKSSKTSLEGFASSVRARIRMNIENSYSILHGMGKLGDSFYGIQQLPEMLAGALLSTASHLPPHHFSTLLLMVRTLFDECPPSQREHFVPPVLSTLLSQIDHKCTTEWQKLERRRNEKIEDENLAQEMREDSVLRQFTNKSVNLTQLLLDPNYELQLLQHMRELATTPVGSTPPPSMRETILSNPHILEPLLLFCTHALSYRDTKACAAIVRAIRTLIPAFATISAGDDTTASMVREFISSELLKAAITSLNDGYFADQQRDLANLIGTVWIAYGLPTHMAATETQPASQRPPLTATPRNILLSLPGVTAARVDATAAKLAETGGVHGNLKHQRAHVLALLEGLRGVRLSELGKIDTRLQKTKLLEKYALKRETLTMASGGDMEGQLAKVDIEREGVDLGGVADMFS